MWSPVLLSPPLVVAGIGGVFSRTVGQDGAPGRGRALHGQRAAGGVLPRPRGGPQARRVAAVVVQPADGAADLGARADGHGRRHGSARVGAAAGAVMAADDRRPDVGRGIAGGAHLPKLRPGTQPPPPSLAAAAATGHYAPQMNQFSLTRISTSSTRSDTWDRSHEEGRVGPARAARPVALLHRCGGQPERWWRSATSCSPRTPSRGCRWPRGHRHPRLFRPPRTPPASAPPSAVKKPQRAGRLEPGHPVLRVASSQVSTASRTSKSGWPNRSSEGVVPRRCRGSQDGGGWVPAAGRRN